MEPKPHFYDIDMPDSPTFSKRCGVKFGALSELQKEKIVFLVKKFEKKTER
jgi:hypothetical protein